MAEDNLHFVDTLWKIIVNILGIHIASVSSLFISSPSLAKEKEDEYRANQQLFEKVFLKIAVSIQENQFKMNVFKIL